MQPDQLRTTRTYNQQLGGTYSDYKMQNHELAGACVRNACEDGRRRVMTALGLSSFQFETFCELVRRQCGH